MRISSAAAAMLPDVLEVEALDAWRWLIPRQGKMRTEGLVYADARMMEDLRRDEALRQVANVACLPGIVGRSIGMPDIHWGYGFAIGGVAAFDPELGGVISPGGVGYDINCGVRLLRSDLLEGEIRPHLASLMNQIMRDVPAGVGAHQRRERLTDEDLREIMVKGAQWVVEKGWGVPVDVQHTESRGALDGADPDQVSPRAVERGRSQLGTVGSGNHFIEIGYVGEVFDADAASAMGLHAGCVTALIHSGSRGLGHQVCTDYLEVMLSAAERYGVELPDASWPALRSHHPKRGDTWGP